MTYHWILFPFLSPFPGELRSLNESCPGWGAATQPNRRRPAPADSEPRRAHPAMIRLRLCRMVLLLSLAALTAPCAEGFSLLGPFLDQTNTNFPSNNKVENYGASAQIDYNFGNVALTSITSYRRSNAATTQDSDFSPSDLLSASLSLGMTF